MRRSFSPAAVLSLALAACLGTAARADESAASGEWTKRRANPRAAEKTDENAALPYRPSRQYDPPVKAASAESTTGTEKNAVVNADYSEPVPEDAAKTPAANASKPAPYNGAGKLVRLRAKDGRTGYALVDASGRPQIYLTKSSQIDLPIFVNQNVRILGKAQRLDGSSLPVVTPERITRHQIDRNVRPAIHNQAADAAPPFHPNTQFQPGAAAPESITPNSAAPDSGIEEVPPPRSDLPAAPMSSGALKQPLNDRAAAPEVIAPEPSTNSESSESHFAPGEFPPDIEGGEFVADDGPDYIPVRRGPFRHPGGPLHGILDRMNGSWFRADFMFMGSESMRLPPLATTSPPGTAQANAGVLGANGTTVLFGNEELFDESRAGGRIRFGTWLDSAAVWGLEGEFLSLEDSAVAFAASSNGSPILARPFFDVVNGRESSRLIAFPGVAAGDIEAAAMTRFQGSAARLRMNASRDEFADDGPPGFWDEQWRQSDLPGANYDSSCSGYRLDVVGGYRYLQLDDQLTVASFSQSANGNTSDMIDAFDVTNRFNGGEIGLALDVYRRRWTLELLTKIAIGTNTQEVMIAGQTITTTAGGTRTDPAGFLAQRTNSGTHEISDFAVVPELGVTVGYQLTRHMRLNLGYSLIYWSGVARAGDQIDLDINPNLIPPPGAAAGANRPQFNLVESDFWAHGLTAGVDFRW